MQLDARHLDLHIFLSNHHVFPHKDPGNPQNYENPLPLHLRSQFLLHNRLNHQGSVQFSE